MTNNFVRIIAGQWRSRRLTFPAVTDLRPTPDRVRETLFNWLMPHIHGARCLDAFAGSGALGFEALSRGASYSVFLDAASEVIGAITKNAQLLNTEQYETHCTDALKWLSKPALHPFHIVFLDPPYALNLIQPCLNLLRDNQYINQNSVIYIEDNQPLPDFEGFEKYKEAKAAQVYYALLKPTR